MPRDPASRGPRRALWLFAFIAVIAAGMVMKRVSKPGSAAPTYTNIDEARRALTELIPLGASVEDALRRGRSSGLECSEIVDGVVYCSTTGRAQSAWVGRKWLAELHFTDGSLANVVVREGLTGP